MQLNKIWPCSQAKADRVMLRVLEAQLRVLEAQQCPRGNKHKHIEALKKTMGADAKLVLTKDGKVVHVNLAEKLLVPLMAKASNFVIGGGIWLNTQRPEWNDANNAIVGFGLSMVTPRE